MTFQILKLFTEFNTFDDPLWPVNAFLLVVLKSSSQVDQRARLKRQEVQDPKAQKAKAVTTKAKAANGRKGRKAELLQVKEDPVEALAEDITMMSITQGMFIFTIHRTY
jgi:hypothetical protein